MLMLSFLCNSSAYAATILNQQTTTEDDNIPEVINQMYKDQGIIFKSTIIPDNKSVNSIMLPQTSYIILEQYWVVTPYEYDTKYWVTYTPYLVSDNYQCPSEVKNTVTGVVEASIQLGFSGGFSSSEATKYNLSVSASVTAKASGSFSSEMFIPGWTAKGIRAYVKWTEHLYKGQLYTKYMFSGVTYEETNWVYAADKSLRSSGVKYWEVYNSAHDPGAGAPNPPEGWDG
jgi:hypothetical protein